jgi:CubicO group peptidase (beta-lactamase class C family)
MRLLAAALFCAVSCACTAGESLSGQEQRSIENGLVPKVVLDGEAGRTYAIGERMNLFKTPGLGMAVLRNGRVLWAKGYGVADATSRAPVGVHTRFQAASISKPATALGVLKLVQARHLDLDRNVNDYLTRWKIDDNAFTRSEKVTIRRLLNHTAGLNVGGFPGYAMGDRMPDTAGVLDGRGNTPKVIVEAVPGTRYAYSGGGYVVLQQLVEDLTGKPFERYMQEAVLKPLGMRDSSFEAYPQEEHGLAHGFDGRPYEGGWHVYPERAPAGLWSTPSDLGKLCSAVRDSLKGTTGAFLPQAVARQMLTPSKAPGGGDAYGLGLELRGSGASASFGHGGSNAGFKGELFCFVERDLDIALMTNADNGRLVRNEFARALSNHFHLGLFPPKTVHTQPIDAIALAGFAGTYQLADDKSRLFQASVGEGRQLLFKDLGNGKTNTFVAVGTDAFIDRYSGEQAAFARDAAGRVQSLLYDGDDKLLKIAQ